MSIKTITFSSESLSFLQHFFRTLSYNEKRQGPTLVVDIMPYFHVYNRGAHRALIFNDIGDYDRFLALMYLANNTEPIIFKKSLANVFCMNRKRLIVSIFTYCLMPNHFHFGISADSHKDLECFMRKICTAYVMYYNKKYNHFGTIFQGKYKSREIDTENYLATVIEYIHLNPFGIEEPSLISESKWEYRLQAFEYSKNYNYSSLKDYLGEKRPQSTILSTDKVRPWLWNPISSPAER